MKRFHTREQRLTIIYSVLCLVLMVIVIQTSYLTPPMAPSIFYLRSIAPKEVTYRDMCLGVTPYVIMQLVTLLAVIVAPALATYLPSQLKGF